MEQNIIQEHPNQRNIAQENPVQENTACYGLVDNNGVLINPIIAVKDDFITLEKLKTFHNAANYHLLDTSLYVVRIGEIYWNGVHWDLTSNKVS
jgi:hypothetical protein